MFNRAPDAEVSVPEGRWTNRYQRYGDVWFLVTDLERRIVPVGEHWLLYHIERLTPAVGAVAWECYVDGDLWYIENDNSSAESFLENGDPGSGAVRSIVPLYRHAQPIAGSGVTDEMVEAGCEAVAPVNTGHPWSALKDTRAGPVLRENVRLVLQGVSDYLRTLTRTTSEGVRDAE